MVFHLRIESRNYEEDLTFRVAKKKIPELNLFFVEFILLDWLFGNKNKKEKIEWIDLTNLR